jgi:alkylation response protein AidB-like acyl-CoA dehydrogenase
MTEALKALRPGDASRSTILERVRALGPLIEQCAAANETATQIADPVIDALYDNGIFHLMVPHVLGGEEAHPDAFIDAISELSYFDGSVGWFAHAVMTGGAVSGAHLGERAIEAIYGGPHRALCAGQAAPTGKAERVGDGYRISGRYSFGSGSAAASHLVGGYIVHEGGKPVLNAAGMPVMLVGFAARDTVDFLGNWDVLGLRGTGSYDFAVREQVLHEDFFFEAGAAPVRRGGALYRMGFMAIPSLSHAAFALGCARRALDEWRHFAQTKPRGPKGTLARDLQTTQRDLAMAEAELRAADAYVRRTFAMLFDQAEAGEALDEQLRIDGRLCASHALAVGLRVTQTAFTACTTYGLRNGTILQRCLRDMQAGNAHFLTAEQSFIDAGAVLAGVPGASIIF